jgi:hypothetical protein
MQNNNLNSSLPEDFRGLHIHFVGIKGTGMAALVEILFHKADMVGVLAPNALWAFAHGVVYRSLSADVLKDEDRGNGGLRKLWR